jgi:hypothetical protein
MTDEPIGHALEVRAQPLLPMAPEEAGQVMRAYQETCRAVLTRDDVQRVGDREFTKRSGFQKLAAAYGVSTEIVSIKTSWERVVDEDGESQVLIARAVVRATHPTGRHAEGDGTCSAREKRFRRGGEKIDHDLPATAVTRATNRAVSNLIAFGTVSAEEAEGSLGTGGPVAAAPLPGWAAHMSDDSIKVIAENLTRILKAAGVEDTAVRVNTIGQEIFDLCDKGFPFALARLAKLLADATEKVDLSEKIDELQPDEAFDVLGTREVYDTQEVDGEAVDETTTNEQRKDA